MYRLWLDFVQERTFCLEKTRFACESNERVLETVRGKTCGAFIGRGTFQWTNAVRALSVAILRRCLADITDQNEAVMIGYHRSLARSLDYALSKEPLWLADMFGVDASGRALGRMLFLRSNSGARRSGPVVLQVNPRLIPGEKIHVRVNDAEINDSTSLGRLIKEIENEDTCARNVRTRLSRCFGQPSIAT